MCVQQISYQYKCIFYYPRVTNFDALKQWTGICAHLITFSSRKYIILNKLSCFQSKHTFSEVREHLFCLKCQCAAIIYFDRHQFRRLSLAVAENDFFTVVQRSQGVLCILYKEDQTVSAVKNQQGECSMRSYNFKMDLNNVSQLKYYSIKKNMHYCIQNIYHMYYAT